MQIRDFGSKMQQVARKTAPDWTTKKIKKKKSSPLIIQFRTATLQHTFKASDLVPDIFQSNTASRYVFILPTWPFSLQKNAFSQLSHSEVSWVYPSHFHIDSFRSLLFGLKYNLGLTLAWKYTDRNTITSCMYQSTNVISDDPAAWCTLWVEQRCMFPDLVCAQHTELLAPMAEPLAAVLFIGIVVGGWPASWCLGWKLCMAEVAPLYEQLHATCRGFPWKQPSISFSVGECRCDSKEKEAREIDRMGSSHWVDLSLPCP